MDQLNICIIIFVLTLVSYMANLIPMSVTALSGMALLALTGCVDAATILGGFANTNTTIMASMFVIAASLNRTSFIDKLSNGITELAKGSFKKAYFCYILLAMLLTSFLTSPMVAFAVIFPLASTMCKSFNVSPSKIMFPLVVICVGCCCILPFGAAITQAANINGFLETYGFTNITITALDFTVGRIPLLILLILWAYFIGPKFAPDKPPVSISASDNASKSEMKPLSPFRDFMGAFIFFASVTMLIFGSKLVPAWQVCFVGAILTVICGVLSEKEAIANIPFSMVFLYVGALAMGNALNATGAGIVIGDWMSKFVGGTQNSYVLGAMFFLVTFILTQFMLNQAVMNIFIPICLLTCKAIGANPIGLLILVVAGSLTAFATPMATPAIPMAMGAGGYDIRSLFKQSWLICIILAVSYIFYTMTIYPCF